MNKPTRINVEDIRLDGGTQSRAELSDDVIQEYAAYYADKVEMPPVVVYFDGTDRWLADGFHRVMAAKWSGIARIAAEIVQGSQRDAVLYSCGANAKHGMRRTNADKRRAVGVLLRDDEWAAKSDRWIADQCGVSHPFVIGLRPQVVTVTTSTEAAATLPGKRIGQDGKNYPATQPRKPPAELDTQSPTIDAPEPRASKPRQREVVEYGAADSSGSDSIDELRDVGRLRNGVIACAETWRWGAETFNAAVESARLESIDIMEWKAEKK